MLPIVNYIYSEKTPIKEGSLAFLGNLAKVKQLTIESILDYSISEIDESPSLLILDRNILEEQVIKCLEHMIHFFPGNIIPVILLKSYSNKKDIPEETPFDILQSEIDSEAGKIKINQLLSMQKQLKQKENEVVTTAARESHFRRTNQMKDKLFSIISHDIKGPLNTLNAMLDVIVKHPDAFSQEELQHYSHDIKNSLNGVRFLLENLMHWSLSQMDMMEFKPDTIDIEYVINQNLRLFTPSSKVKEIELEADVIPLPGIEGDINMIDFVVRNLISNALKFTEKGGTVKVSTNVAEDESEVLISIEDTGIGISKEKISNLFFIEDHSTTFGTANEKGNGLGLGLSKDFIERNGGSITVESTPGKGSKFTFTLPIS